MSSKRLTDLFLQKQRVLLAQLNMIDFDSVSHNPTRGRYTEHQWGKILEGLPARYAVAYNGFAIDSNGAISREIDIIIYDNFYTPMILRDGGVDYVAAESIYAVLEVKQDLTKENIEDAGEKAKSVRCLYRNSAPFLTIDNTLRKREGKSPILAGILTTRSNWNPPFGAAFERVLTGLDEESQLDYGIALEHGSFSNSRSYATHSNNGARDLKYTDSGNALIRFYMNLLKELQLLGNAMAVDYEAYMGS